MQPPGDCRLEAAQGDRSGLTRAQRPSEAQSNKLCDPSMGEQNLLSKAASFRGQWFTSYR